VRIEPESQKEKGTKDTKTGGKNTSIAPAVVLGPLNSATVNNVETTEHSVMLTIVMLGKVMSGTVGEWGPIGMGLRICGKNNKQESVGGLESLMLKTRDFDKALWCVGKGTGKTEEGH